jgi:DNA invertase Pin-like site-specific DNA recombinase
MAGMVVGYARTSTVDQEAGFEAQKRDLTAAGCEKVFAEKVSSVAERAELKACLGFLREGDTLVVTKPDRLARSTADLLTIQTDLERRGVHLVIQSMGLDTRQNGNNPTTRLILTVLGAIAQFERELMLERQREGVAAAKAAGKYKGRPPSIKPHEVKRMLETGMGPASVAKQLKVARSSVYRVMEENGWKVPSRAA